jgi:hypothetical protein
MVRSDLSPPQQAVQACHAVQELTRQGHFAPDGVTPNLVLLEARDEADLVSWWRSCVPGEPPSVIFYEPDLGDAATAWAVGPVAGADRKAFRHMPLLKEKQDVIL